MNINSTIRHRAQSVDLKAKAAKALITFMDRRIPTTVPAVSEQKGDLLESKLQPGDIVLTSDCAYPGWGRMEYWAVGSNYTHAAIVGNDSKIYEATGAGVIASDVDGYFKGHLKTAILRPDFVSPKKDAESITEYCKSHVGKNYDNLFLDDDSEFYCSELVAKALTQVTEPLATPSKDVLGRKAIAPFPEPSSAAL